MPGKKKYFIAIKNKAKKFRKDEQGGDILIQILIIAFTLVVIAFLLVWTLDLLNAAKEKAKDLVEVSLITYDVYISLNFSISKVI